MPTKNTVPATHATGDRVTIGCLRGTVAEIFERGLVNVRWDSGQYSALRPGLLTREDNRGDPVDASAAPV